MAPDCRSARLARTLSLTALLLAALATSAHALRLVSYNILNYPGSTAPARNPLFRTVLSPLGADLVAAGEVLSQAGVDQFLSGVLNTMEPGQWAAAPFIDGNDTDGALFYKTAKFQFLGEWAFYPNPANPLRLVHVYRLKPVGYTSGAAELRFYACHLKASTGYESQRLAEATGMRDSMNAMPSGTHAFALGDFNLYTGTEPALAKFLESQANNTGRLYDPLGLQGIDWQDNAGIAIHHTQSPCLDNTGVPCASGAATGGLDDRFDLILPTLNWNNGQTYELLPASYVSVGNDGLHMNHNINATPTIPEGAAYAAALKGASDHIPIRVDLQLPAKITTDAALAFGTVIVGATASQNLAVANPATPPADALDYSFTPPAGFTAPGGAFSLAAGAPAASHAIGMNTATAGSKSGSLSVASDDLDYPVKSVALGGTVLDHAVAALDSTTALLASSLDFGTHAAGQFSPQTVAVHNFGYGASQAQLALNAAAITSGDGRFSIAGGFTPALIARVGQRYDVAFDGTGATLDSTYEATLTFTSADEALPGALPQPDLVVALAARVTTGQTGVGNGTAAPAFTRLHAPFPNPLQGATTVRFDLAQRTEARLEVFDLSGRRVATLADGAFEPGQYARRWDGRVDAGANAGPGLYFVRLSGRGLAPQSARLAVVR